MVGPKHDWYQPTFIQKSDEFSHEFQGLSLRRPGMGMPQPPQPGRQANGKHHWELLMLGGWVSFDHPRWAHQTVLADLIRFTYIWLGDLLGAFVLVNFPAPYGSYGHDFDPHRKKVGCLAEKVHHPTKISEALTMVHLKVHLKATGHISHGTARSSHKAVCHLPDSGGRASEFPGLGNPIGCRLRPQLKNLQIPYSWLSPKPYRNLIYGLWIRTLMGSFPSFCWWNTDLAWWYLKSQVT